jgi:hypothetical protein
MAEKQKSKTKTRWRPFEEAREYARSLGLQSYNEWCKFVQGMIPELNQKPYDMPSNPSKVYLNDGWISWHDWLGKKPLKYRDFECARQFVRKLNLQKIKEWTLYCKGELPLKGQKPADIPATPNKIYKNIGWVNWGDWLGTGRIATYNRSFRSFEKACQYAKELGLKSLMEWVAFSQGKLKEKGFLPSDIPASPDSAYKDKGWISWPHFLGTGPHRKFKPFKEAQGFAVKLGLKSSTEWLEFVNGYRLDLEKKPDDIPAYPNKAYEKYGWKGYRDWLGLPERRWRPFKEARQYARSLKLKSLKEWLEFARGENPDLGKKPDDIPVRPLDIYKFEGWSGYNNWLGLSEQWRSFRNARGFVRKLGLQTINEWRLYCRGKLCDSIGVKPENIPVAPDSLYKNKGWISWNDFLGNEVLTINKIAYEPFTHARKHVHSLNLSSQKEWFSFCGGEDLKSDNDLKIPLFPNTVYHEHGWSSWRDWLGLRCNAQDCNFKEARDFARSLNLTSNKAWRKYCRGELINKPPLPENISADPERVYRGRGWVSWGDFLGTGKVSVLKLKMNFKPFEEARAFVQKLGLKTVKEWKKYCAGELPEKGFRPCFIPSSPNRTYKKSGWISWPDWLRDSKAISRKTRNFKSYEEAKSFVRTLELKGAKEWFKYNREGNKPTDIPANPENTYKNEGWVSWGDFLGTGNVANYKKNFRTFKDARKFVRSLNFNSSFEWYKYSSGNLFEMPKKPDDIPYCPSRTYKNKGWNGWADFLGYE